MIYVIIKVTLYLSIIVTITCIITYIRQLKNNNFQLVALFPIIFYNAALGNIEDAIDNIFDYLLI